MTRIKFTQDILFPLEQVWADQLQTRFDDGLMKLETFEGRDGFFGEWARHKLYNWLQDLF